MDIRNSFKKININHIRFEILGVSILMLILAFIAPRDYLLFHSLAEFFSAAICLAIFMIVWNSKDFSHNNTYIFLGTAFFTIGLIKLLHGLAYKGMGVFPGTTVDSNLATQLWILSQYVMAISFVIAPFLIGKKMYVRITLLGYFLVFTTGMLLIFYWKIFPTCYVEGSGLTPFKIYSEYFVAFLLLIACYFFWLRRKFVHPTVLKLIIALTILFFISTTCFTLYVSVYSIFNELGHLFSIIGFYISYLALVEFALMKPYEGMFGELKKSEKKYRAVVDNQSDLICRAKPDGTITFVNPAYCKFYGKTPEELLGIKYFFHLLPEDIISEKEHLKTFNIKNSHKKIQHQSINSQGEIRWVDWTDQAFFDKQEKIIEFQFVGQDITDKKNIDKVKDDFISLASHQLRTPLAAISLSSELLLRGISGDIQNEAKEYLDEISKAAKRMTLLINNLLNVSRLEMGSFNFNLEPFDIRSNLITKLKELMPIFMAKKLIMKSDISDDLPTILFDENSFGIIFDNLLSNAMRYTGVGGLITVSVKQDKNKNILLEVSDSGCGIPKDQQNSVFDKSFRADNAKKISSEGAGLGLYMIKKLADKTGTKVWFESTEGKGTTFYFQINYSSIL